MNSPLRGGCIRMARPRTRRWSLRLLTEIAALCLGSMPASSAQAHNWLGQCTVDFDNLFALTNVIGNARGTFASRTRTTASGPENCSDPNDSSCFIYRHRCFNDYVHVDELNGYNHFHLIFESPELSSPCDFVAPDPDDGFGLGYAKLVGSECTVPDWKQEPRYLVAHTYEHWIRIRLNSQAGVQRVFDMPRIHFGGTSNVWVRFQRTDHSWWGWYSLAPGNYDMSAWIHDVYEVHVRSASDTASPVTLLDFDILD